MGRFLEHLEQYRFSSGRHSAGLNGTGDTGQVVQLVARANSVTNQVYMVAVLKQAEHRLIDTDMGLHASYNDLTTAGLFQSD